METVIATLLVIDKAIQCRFDTLVFFLMRTLGCRKSIIRYALWGTFVLTGVVWIYGKWIINNHKLDWTIVWNGLWLLPILFLQWRDYQHDLTAEKRGMHSAIDVVYERFIGSFKIVFGLGLFLWLHLTINAWFVDDHPNAYIFHIQIMRDVSQIVGRLSLIAMFYLVRTPPTPPLIKHVSTVLVPAPQQTD
jgi:hypothetical protein